MKTDGFKSLSRDRVRQNTEKLNLIMFPLMKGNTETSGFHNAMVEVVENLNATSQAYNGSLEGIWPKIGDTFDPELHELERQTPFSHKISSSTILWTTMCGIRYRPAGKEWRTCSRAKVVLREFTSNESKADLSNPSESMISLRPTGPATRSEIPRMSVSTSRKRQYHDLTKV